MTAAPLSTGGDQDPLLPRLRREIHRADTIDLAVSFILVSGLELILDDLIEAMEKRDAKVRILTTDYLYVTEPEALRRLMLLEERGAQVRIFEAVERSFHLKAYLFVGAREDGLREWSAYVGSSNLTRTALLDGIEWNYRVSGQDVTADGENPRFHEIQEAFERLFEASDVIDLSWAWIEAYEGRRPTVQARPVPGLDGPDQPPPTPHRPQREALEALERTREEGNHRGLVVMATGLGKTWLAAFDVDQTQPERVLFVAHREEILLQAERTFQRILPGRRIGRYNGSQKDHEAEVLFASIQTLSRVEHLDAFSPEHFGYVIIDEFHHAAAQTYRRVLRHFQPRFLLGLTATPSRTDRSDILSLCDDNLVYVKDLHDAIGMGLLVPFGYWGIWDRTVDYQEIPWRSGRFDPHALEARLATMNRARHVLDEWERKKATRTLAFCASRKHADFMADHFSSAGVSAASVHGASPLDRGSAVEALTSGALEVVFSVDLFNEGVDIPALDTVMMLRPTESPVLFLQQLGRGLRLHEEKEHLTVLDFVGNHRGFLHKPQALLGIEPTTWNLGDLRNQADENGRIVLPDGCFVNFDLTLLNLWEERAQTEAGIRGDYRTLRDSLGRRPTAAEFHRAGADVVALRRDPGHWWALVNQEADLAEPEVECLQRHEAFFREVETTAMTRSFKMVLLQAFIDLGGFLEPPTLQELSTASLEIFRRRRRLASDLAASVQDVDNVDPNRWHRYWAGNPVNAWTGGNRSPDKHSWFDLEKGRFRAAFEVTSAETDTFHAMLQELIDLRLARYGERVGGEFAETLSATTHQPSTSARAAGLNRYTLPLFQGVAEAAQWRERKESATGSLTAGEKEKLVAPPATHQVDAAQSNLDPERHFLMPKESVDGLAKDPDDKEGFLLLEWIEPRDAANGHLNEEGSGAADAAPDSTAPPDTSHLLIAYSRPEGGSAYSLETVAEEGRGQSVSRAQEPDYSRTIGSEGLRVMAKVLGVVS